MKKFLLAWTLAICFANGFAAAPVVTSFTPLSASNGMTVTITGTDFTNATSVSFGNTPAASFTVVSPTQITAVVANGTSGAVRVTNIDGSFSLPGFNYVTTSRIITDFGGYWPSSMTSVNPLLPDSSHHLLAFTYRGITYSTGVNNNTLTNQGISYFSSNFKALPVAGVTGVTGPGSTYLALAKKVDGSATVAYTPAVANFSVKSVLVDGVNGLDLGTGVTNLPTTAVLTFQVFNVNPTKVSDDEPDIILTQIADPSSGNDIFSFVDASGVVVGNTISQNMTMLPGFGNYGLDLYNLTPTTPYNTATAYSPSSTNVTRGIRVVAFRLSDFGITPANVGQIKALKLTPSGNSDYAFIGYNVNAMNLPPNISVNDAETSTSVCNGGTVNLSVLASAAAGGELSYSWEESTNGGTIWSPVSNGGIYTGATTNQLLVVNATNGYKYRATVQETGNPNGATSSVFTVAIIAGPTAPSAVSIAGPVAFCLNTPAQLTSTVTGGSNLYYQWQSNASGSYENIPGANLNTLEPVIDETGIISYRLMVSSGNGCVPVVTSTPLEVSVAGVSSITPAASCGTASLTLNATATAGTLSWFTTDNGGTAVGTGNSFATPVISSSRIYYVSASGCATALRVPVQATIYPLTVGGIVTGGTTVTPNTNSTTLQLTGETGDVLQWQSSVDNFATQVTDIPVTSKELTITNLSQSTQYRALIQSGSCSSTFSSVASIVVSDPLPIRTGSFKATLQANGVLLKWKAYEQSHTKQFDVQRSSDGSTFHSISVIQPQGMNESDYQWLDKTADRGDNYYRIKEVQMNDSWYYSNILKVKIDRSFAAISVYPNPLTGNMVSVNFHGVSAGSYSVQLINATGQTIREEKLVHDGGNKTYKILVQERMPLGFYTIVVNNSRDLKFSTGIIVL